MTIDRREALKYALLCSFLSCRGVSADEIVNVSPADRSTPRLLVVMLRGACDTDSLIYQYKNSFYYDARPNIAIGRSGNRDDLLTVDSTWALHPAFFPLSDLISRREMVFVPFSGSDDISRSHFQAQEVMESGIPSSESIGNTPGWLNRVVSQLKRDLPQGALIGGTNFGRASSLICRGPEDMPDMQLNGGRGSLAGLQRRYDILMKMYTESGYAERLSSVNERNIQLEQERMFGKTHGGEFENMGDLVNRFSQVGRLMRVGKGFCIGFLDVNGWDTHVGQGADSGPLASKFRQLALGLSAYRNEMISVWSNTHVVVISEFGRTFRENGNRGTDHGRGGTMLLLSGNPYSNKILGEQLIHSQSTLNENRDLPVLNDYRNTIAKYVLERMGLSAKSARNAMRLI